MRGANCTHYRWHVVGKIDDNAIDRKYCSISQFLSEYQYLNIDRYKLRRIRQGQKASGFEVDIKKIDEKRKFAVVYLD